MAFIPEDTKWYVAELVQELKVADDPRNLVWRNLTLIRADTPENAYSEALRIGTEGNTQYDNPEGKRVEVKFRGIAFLDAVHNELENGAELLFTSAVDVSEEQLSKILRSKEDLNVFRSLRRIDGPDVSAGYVVEEAMRMLDAPQEEV